MGTLRFVLALLVVFQHIALIPFVGGHAVIFFFVISGYLMTLVMQTSYAGEGGLARFWANRVLRLYPAYGALIALSVAVFLAIPDGFTRGINSNLRLPADLSGWLQSLTMIYVDFTPQAVSPRIAPATWAITTELVFYLMISLGASRSKRRALVWFSVSLVYVAWSLLQDDPYRYVYSAIPAGSLPFSCGALIFHYRENLARLLADRAPMVLFAGLSLLAGIMALRIAGFIRFDSDVLGPYAILSTVPIALVVSAALVTSRWSPFPRTWDKLLGDLSYPIYICHWTAALTAAWVLEIPQRSRSIEGLILTVATIALSVLFGVMVTRLIDRRIERYREAIRNRRMLAGDPIARPV